MTNQQMLARDAAATPSGPLVEDRTDRYCIIGAGPAGLGTARSLQRAGIRFDVLERQSAIGGIWNGDAGRTPMYATAHFISSSTVSGFPDYPMPSGYPDYPGWRQILDYLRAFARDNDLERRVELGSEVRHVARVNDAWEVSIAGGSTRRYRGVVLASGHQWTPRVPTYPGTFTGTAYHAFDYWSPDEMRGKRVLVVGGGNSGCDIACDAAASASRALISLRRGYHFLPKHLFGKPTDAFFRSGPELPTWLAQPLLGLLLRIVVGDLTRYGLPRPDHKVLESHPIVNSQLLHYLAHGDVTAKPDVRELDGRTVHFTDGSEEEVDLIIWATGYDASFPYLAPGIIDAEDPTRALFANVVHRDAPELYVVGLFETDGGAYPVIGRQAELVRGAIEARSAGGAAGERLARLLRDARPDLSGGVRYLASPRHRIYVQYEAYTHYLDRLARQLPARQAAVTASTGSGA